MDMLRSLVIVAACYCTHDLTIKITWSKDLSKHRTICPSMKWPSEIEFWYLNAGPIRNGRQLSIREKLPGGRIREPEA
jgi:hypothetical protein